MPDDKALEIAINALEWEREAVKVLRAFVRKHMPAKPEKGK
jgi:hypothetical protein